MKKIRTKILVTMIITSMFFPFSVSARQWNTINRKLRSQAESWVWKNCRDSKNYPIKIRSRKAGRNKIIVYFYLPDRATGAPVRQRCEFTVKENAIDWKISPQCSKDLTKICFN